MVLPDPTAIERLKAQWRAEMRRRLAAMPESDRMAESCRICEVLAGSLPWRRARVVLLYAPLPGEPDVRPLWRRALEEGRQLALPRYDPVRDAYVPALVTRPEEDLCHGRYGVKEPRPELPALGWDEPDLIVVPGLAFDPWGARLGRGGGHYDRMLRLTHGFRCGVAFRCQWTGRLPALPHDVRMHAVVTAGGWFEVELKGPEPPGQDPAVSTR